MNNFFDIIEYIKLKADFPKKGDLLFFFTLLTIFSNYDILNK